MSDTKPEIEAPAAAAQPAADAVKPAAHAAAAHTVAAAPTEAVDEADTDHDDEHDGDEGDDHEAEAADEHDAGSKPADGSAPAKKKRKPRRRPVEATVSAIAGEWVLVELAEAKRGAAPLAQFEKPPEVGAKITLVQTGPPSEEGLVPLRRPQPPQLQQPSPWRTLQRGDIIEAVVTGMNIGGLELKYKERIKCFMPASQVELTPIEDPAPYLKQTLTCGVLEVDRRNRRLVVSKRVLLERELRKAKFAELKYGQDLEGTIRKIEPFGAFVELGDGIDGLVRPPDISWAEAEDPTKLVKVGDKVKVKILAIDRRRGRIELGIKQATPDPWQAVETKYPVGSKITGKVTKCADFGAFVELEPGVEGLIHISQLSERRVEKVEQVVRPGMSVEAKVTENSARRRRVSLSIRALTAPEASPNAEASRDDMKKYVKKADKAHAGESLGALLNKFGGDSNLKGGLG
jgi:small subunit ribosomal protein S1